MLVLPASSQTHSLLSHEIFADTPALVQLDMQIATVGTQNGVGSFVAETTPQLHRFGSLQMLAEPSLLTV